MSAAPITGETTSGEYALVPTADPETGAAEKSSNEEKERHLEELQTLKTEVTRLQDLETRAEKQISNMNTFWENKKKDLASGLEDLTRNRKQAEEELHILDHPHLDLASIPPGPKCLHWVRGNRFTAVSSFVVVANLVTMFMEMVHPHYKEDFFVLDQVVLVFYISEIVLKGFLFQRELLFGPCGVVWWNWLDLIIVIVGILDQWVGPFVLTGASDSRQSTTVQMVKMLRLLRLARILKTVRAFLQSDLSWAEGHVFQLFIMGVIAANSLIMSFESDYPDFVGWFYVEQALLMIFSFELLVRLRHWGFSFFYHPSDFVWNWLDFIIVTGGMIDQWLMPAWSLVEQLMGMKSQQGGNMGEIMTTLRMARLLRILRLVRLVKNIPPLFTLIVGILQAMQGMAWVLVLTAVFLYAFAILSVRLVGHGLLFGGNAPPEVAQIFPSVPQSMFVLFKVMNGDMEPVEPLFEAFPMSKLGFVLYMVVSSWAILSILTAVVSENMINATEAHREALDEEMQTMKLINTKDYLSELFTANDKDGSGELGEDEFEGMLSDDATCKMLTDQTNLKKADLEQVFSLLMTKDKVSQDVFIDALQNESRAVTERSVFRLEKRLIDLQTSFQKHLEDLSAKEEIKEEADTNKVENLLEKLFTVLEHKETGIQASLAKIVEHLLGSRKEQLVVGNEQLGSRKEQLVVGKLAPIPEPCADSLQYDVFDLNKRLLPMESALQRIERRLNSVALESDLQRLEVGSTGNQETTAFALATLEDYINKHRFSAQSILTKVEMHLATMQDVSMVEPLMRKLEIQLQDSQKSASDMLMARIERKLDMAGTWKQVQSEFACLIGEYEQRLTAEMNRGVSSIQTLSSLLRPGILRQIDAHPLPCWTAAHLAAAAPSLGIQSMNQESEQAAGLTSSARARGATGGTLE